MLDLINYGVHKGKKIALNIWNKWRDYKSESIGYYYSTYCLEDTFVKSQNYIRTVAQMVKNLPAVWEIQVWSLRWEDPLEKGNGYPLQYYYLENPHDRGAWRATVQGVAKSQRRLSE